MYTGKFIEISTYENLKYILEIFPGTLIKNDAKFLWNNGRTGSNIYIRIVNNQAQGWNPDAISYIEDGLEELKLSTILEYINYNILSEQIIRWLKEGE